MRANWDDDRSGLSLVHSRIYRMCVNEKFLDGALLRWSVPWDHPSHFLQEGEHHFIRDGKDKGNRKRLYERDIPYGDLYLGFEAPAAPNANRTYAFVTHCCLPHSSLWPTERRSVGDHEMNFL